MRVAYRAGGLDVAQLPCGQQAQKDKIDSPTHRQCPSWAWLPFSASLFAVCASLKKERGPQADHNAHKMLQQLGYFVELIIL